MLKIEIVEEHEVIGYTMPQQIWIDCDDQGTMKLLGMLIDRAFDGDFGRPYGIWSPKIGKPGDSIRKAADGGIWIPPFKWLFNEPEIVKELISILEECGYDVKGTGEAASGCVAG